MFLNLFFAVCSFEFRTVFVSNYNKPRINNKKTKKDIERYTCFLVHQIIKTFQIKEMNPSKVFIIQIYGILFHTKSFKKTANWHVYELNRYIKL